MRARLKRVAVGALAVYVLLAMALLALQRTMLFPRHLIPEPPDVASRIPGLVRVDVTHADGVSEGWFIPGRGVSAEAPGPVVFFAHGNGELIDYATPGLLAYRAWGVSLAMVEYRGYGRSGGSPTQDGITADQVAFHDVVVARPEVDAGRVVLHGRSLGGGAMAQLAAQRKPRAMVLESTFRSVSSMARRFLMPSFLVLDPFDTEAVLRELDVPLLLFHGDRDEIIPYAHSDALLAAAKDARRVTFHSGHNDLPQNAEYWGAIRAHFGRAGVLPADIKK